MKTTILLLGALLFLAVGCTQISAAKNPAEVVKTEVKRTVVDKQGKPVKLNKLTASEAAVIINKGTERPFTGVYNDFDEDGTYVCKLCGAPLYRSKDKFKSECGWPSFDDEIPGAVKRIPDPDGYRTEIECARCGAHLGHVFENEGFTDKNVRHCVNSISLDFIPARKPAAVAEATSDTAVVAGGCFWGVEYFLQKADGVISTEVGYTDGRGSNPTYAEVSSHGTGYAEAVRVVFDPRKTTYEKILRLFFEIHDPTQLDHQGPDYGDQYRSAVFYKDEQQKRIASHLIDVLVAKGYDVVTKLTPASTFWKAEDYHQDYYKKNHHTPYCHSYQAKF